MRSEPDAMTNKSGTNSVSAANPEGTRSTDGPRSAELKQKLFQWRPNGAVPPPAVTPAEVSAPDAGVDHEETWKRRVHERVLKQLDLERLDTVDERHARAQIRELAQRIMNDEQATISVAA